MKDPILFFSLYSSGSTILADFWNQHPQVHCEGTSPVDGGIGALRDYFSKVPEVMAHRHHDREGTDERMWNAARRWFEGYFEPLALGEDTVIVDKGRRWINHVDTLRFIWPDSRLVVMVRNPLDCWASIVRQDTSVNPFIVDKGGNPLEVQTEKLARYFRDAVGPGPDGAVQPEGPLGYCCKRVEALLLGGPRRYPNVLFVSYEEFCAKPVEVMRKLCIDCGLENFDGWDPEKVEAVTSVDIDAQHNHKFNHAPMGAVRPIKRSKTNWRRMGAMHEKQAMVIARSYPEMFKRWGYIDDLRQGRVD